MKNLLLNTWKFFTKNLIIAVVAMIVLGIVFGTFVPLEVVRIFTTFNGIFSSLLSFTVPLLILALVTVAIAETDRGAGKMLVLTVVLAYVSTVIAGMFTYGVSDIVFPRIISMNVDSAGAMDGVVPEDDIKPYFLFTFPPIMDTMSALLLSFMCGLAILKFNMPVIKGLVTELRDVVMMIITKVVLPLLPIYIFGMFMKIEFSGEMKMITHIYSKVILVMLILFIVVLLGQYFIAGIVSHKNPFKMLKLMFPALITALASSSSAATLPVTLRCAEKFGARKNVVNFVIPMCANIHLSGAAVRTVAITVATMLMFDVPFTTLQYLGFILIFSITVLAAPGIPGGVIMAAVGMIEAMLGFSEEMIAITVTLSITLDSLGTAVNVCGDGALMMLVDTWTKESDSEEKNR